MSNERITEAEAVELERRVAHAPARPNYIELNYCYAMLRRLLSERREREGKLAELFYVREEHGKALLRAEAAEATLARVQNQLDEHEECLLPNGDVTNCSILTDLREALTTPTVSSDQLTPEERENVEDERAFAAKNNTVPSRSILPLIAIIDRLAPPVSPGETQ